MNENKLRHLLRRFTYVAFCRLGRTPHNQSLIAHQITLASHLNRKRSCLDITTDDIHGFNSKQMDEDDDVLGSPIRTDDSDDDHGYTWQPVMFMGQFMTRSQSLLSDNVDDGLIVPIDKRWVDASTSRSLWLVGARLVSLFDELMLRLIDLLNAFILWLVLIMSSDRQLETLARSVHPQTWSPKLWSPAWVSRSMRSSSGLFSSRSVITNFNLQRDVIILRRDRQFESLARCCHPHTCSHQDLWSTTWISSSICSSSDWFSTISVISNMTRCVHPQTCSHLDLRSSTWISICLIQISQDFSWLLVL